MRAREKSAIPNARAIISLSAPGDDDDAGRATARNGRSPTRSPAGETATFPLVYRRQRADHLEKQDRERFISQLNLFKSYPCHLNFLEIIYLL